jgi:hypothetical protein
VVEKKAIIQVLAASGNTYFSVFYDPYLKRFLPAAPAGGEK